MSLCNKSSRTLQYVRDNILLKYDCVDLYVLIIEIFVCHSEMMYIYEDICIHRPEGFTLIEFYYHNSDYHRIHVKLRHGMK